MTITVPLPASAVGEERMGRVKRVWVAMIIDTCWGRWGGVRVRWKRMLMG